MQPLSERSNPVDSMARKTQRDAEIAALDELAEEVKKLYPSTSPISDSDAIGASKNLAKFLALLKGAT